MNRKITLCIFLTGLLFLAGCGKDTGTDGFYSQMDGFYESLSATVAELEGIDPAAETAVDEMLGQLDEMDALFTQLADIEIPDKLEAHFGNIEDLANQAAEYMTEANSLYHDAYVDGGYEDSTAQAAWENYNRAMKRVNYISILLQGRIPEDDNITVITETQEPDWTGGDDVSSGASE